MTGKQTCSICDTEKHINNFHIKSSEQKNCNRIRGLKRYYDI